MQTIRMLATIPLLALAACAGPAWCQHHHGHAHACAACTAAAAAEDEDEDDGDEREVALADVPRVILDAAARAFPHARWTSAEVETEDGRTVWELAGTLDGDPFELELAEDGTVLEFERG